MARGISRGGVWTSSRLEQSYAEIVRYGNRCPLQALGSTVSGSYLRSGKAHGNSRISRAIDGNGNHLKCDERSLLLWLEWIVLLSSSITFQ
jgi:hypothetical protein